MRDETHSSLDERQLLGVLRAFRKGDFSARLPNDLTGIAGEIAEAFNDVVELNERTTRELARLGDMVGKEGKISHRARLPHAQGSWSANIDTVNTLIADTLQPTAEVARVIGAVAKGDLSQTMNLEIDGRELRGEFLRIGKVVNTMVGQLGSFASEVTRVAREVGTEGKLGGQAKVSGVGGTWKDLTDNVNAMAANLTGQVRNIAEVTTAVANGDLSKKITVDVRGEILELKNTINTMVDQLNSFASEVTRVAREVGTEGKLGGQARVEGVAGTWKDLTDNVNGMAANLTGQVRNIADVTTAVARGDLSKKITVDVKGEILELKNTINTMVDQLNSFASEVTRVAREVGTEGKLGGQAKVEGVAGTWKDLTDNVNGMAANLTGQVRNIAEVTTAVATGDLSKKITVDVRGEILELKSTINTMVDQLNSFASEVTRVAREVGTEGKLGGQAQVEGVAGTWKDLTDNVNGMAANLTGQVRNIADVTTAVANGDLSKKITVDVQGEILQLKNTVNTMVDQLNSFASEVTRVAREVGTEGKLGGQAQVKGVAGTWKDLTDNVNGMAANLTGQVRGIADVVTAVAQGNLKRKLTVDAKGEIASLADTINGMIETLATFADQVTNVAREVGIEGKLGGQARVPGAAGLWRDLTDNVNQLAANLTTQVRAIAEVSTAVTKGDLTRSITVEASGEVAALKDNINEMIRNLKDQTLKNTEQDWLKTNLARFSRMLQGERDLATVSNMVLSELAPLVNAQHAVFYVNQTDDMTNEPSLKLAASYAASQSTPPPGYFKFGQGLIGQCAAEKERILLKSVPSDYVKISSGLGEATPLNVIVLPALFEDDVNAVLELASFGEFSETHQVFLDQLMESIGIVLNTIAANMRTESLLEQSQLLTAELQMQQEELKKTNDRLEQQATTLRQSEELLRSNQDQLQTTNLELEEKAQLLSMQNKQVEAKNREVEQAKLELEDKAEQLALTSKYKSEFLANMSHELRTPLNSLLILSKLLAENSAGNLTEKQVEFARTINHAGTDLLALINDILDLSKIESGTVTLDVSEMPFDQLGDDMRRTFAQIAQTKKLDFSIDLDPRLPASIHTDEKRLQQIIKNLLSNAFKFTESGHVHLKIEQASSGWSAQHFDRRGKVVAFTVEDTGIGIPEDKQRLIFEAFQQADGTTSRKYGGTGLGLSISREITRLLGGELTVTSNSGNGSAFTLYLPLNMAPSAQPVRTPVARGISSIQIPEPQTERVADDRETISKNDHVILIVEDDPRFAGVILSMAREAGFKGVVTAEGTSVVPLAKRYHPDAITLDIGLPDMDGFALLDLLKRNPETRHIPIHVISGFDESGLSLEIGAYGVSSKPVERETILSTFGKVKDLNARQRRLLAFEPPSRKGRIADVIGDRAVETESVSEQKNLVRALSQDSFDCVVLDLEHPVEALSDEVIDAIRASQAPVIAYAPESGTTVGTLLGRIERLRVVNTIALLQDDAALCLHRPFEELSDAVQATLQALRRCDPQLAGRKVLVIDDDIRNIFSLTSALEEHGMELHYAESGQAGLELLRRISDADIALVDIMMPGMDGYETIKEIRSIPSFAGLPVIAVTAKAMKGDRQKCIEAGASDYVAKPVDMDQLISVLRVWLHRAEQIDQSRTNVAALNDSLRQQAD
ncbi:HAMP domain-containing protein [Flaviflagellibacter deserti]|uniref:histidine kinase n=1 Tax=Flaviflagellibacter deserti TaxID=2267266 RepID=A0ABV9YW03_9HYPH